MLTRKIGDKLGLRQSRYFGLDSQSSPANLSTSIKHSYLIANSITFTEHIFSFSHKQLPQPLHEKCLLYCHSLVLILILISIKTRIDHIFGLNHPTTTTPPPPGTQPCLILPKPLTFQASHQNKSCLTILE